MPAVLLWKCRLCGNPVEMAATDHPALAIRLAVAGSPGVIGSHDCGGGAVGVIDLIGAKLPDDDGPGRPVAAQGRESAADAA